MLNINGQAIEISRGDTGQFRIRFSGNDAPTANDVVLVRLKRTLGETEAIWEKRLNVSDSAIVVTLLSEDTADLARGQYFWQARILYRDGTIFSPMDPASFKVLGVV